jgi:hypothetical protein
LPFTAYDFLCLRLKHCSKKAAQDAGREAQGKTTRMTKISALCLMPCALSHVFTEYLLKPSCRYYDVNLFFNKTV